MKIESKKIIAREFLILIITIGLGVIFFLCTYLYNSYNNHRVNRLSETIQLKNNLADSLAKPFSIKIKKQKWFFDQFSKYYTLTDDEINTPAKWFALFQHIVKVDSLELRWNTKWDKEQIGFLNKIGFNTVSKFKQFIIENTLTEKDSISKKESEKIIDEIETLDLSKDNYADSILNHKEQLCFGIRTTIIIFILLFGFRYLFYGIKWSIKTLKK